MEMHLKQHNSCSKLICWCSFWTSGSDNQVFGIVDKDAGNGEPLGFKVD